MSDIAAVVADNLDIWTGAIERKSRAGRGGGGKRISLYGIERLRALILDLAVRGKLVPQDTSDEPADELLKRFVTQRSDWVAKKRMRMGKPLPKLGAHELRFEEPTGWQWMRFGDLGDWGAGATPNRKKSAYYGGEVPWFKSGELAADFISVSEETVTELALQECSLRINQPGDVLIAMYGATIGKASILEVEATTNQAVCACTPFHGVDNRFLLLMLKAMKPIFVGQGAGGAQPNISREKIIATPLCLPPLAEQRRIVAKIDELTALCDALEWESANALAAHQTLVETLLATLVNSVDAADLAANWARLESHFDTLFATETSIVALKQAILDLALRGKLVEQNANEGTGSELLANIQVARRASGLRDWVAKPGAKTTNLLDCRERLPASWTVARLGQITTLITDGTHSTPTYRPEGVAFISVKDIDGRTVSFADCKFIDEAEHRQINSRCDPKRNDILLCRIGTLGRPTIVDTDRPFSLFVSVGLLKFVEKGYCPRYQHLALSSPTLARQFDAIKAGGSHTNKLNLGDIPRLEIPLPPLAEQHRIVAKADELMALCDGLKARLADAAETRRHLADAIVERAAA